jgi:hypothetical protein
MFKAHPAQYYNLGVVYPGQVMWSWYSLGQYADILLCKFSDDIRTFVNAIINKEYSK